MVATSKVPRIHDISTDLQDRIEFTPDVAAISTNKDPEPDARAAGRRSTRRRGYPDIAPIQLALPPDQAFAKAKAVAEAMPGWQVTNADRESGRIEATATSRLFHFVDDIVIRVRPDAGGSRVDLRSRSRVGQSDLGANAARHPRLRRARLERGGSSSKRAPAQAPRAKLARRTSARPPSPSRKRSAQRAGERSWRGLPRRVPLSHDGGLASSASIIVLMPSTVRALTFLPPM